MNREFQFQIKSLTEAGEFVGIAAVYENIDLGGDRIKRGAMTKSISENSRVPLLLDHRVPIGVAYCVDTEEGLEVRGKLNLEKSVSQEAYSDLKFYLEHETAYGMSIGYDVVKSSRDGETRVLTEIKIWETSITLFPMNPAAGVRGVKRGGPVDNAYRASPAEMVKGLTTAIEKKDFGSTLNAIQLWAMHRQLMAALDESLTYEVLYAYGEDATKEQRVTNATAILSDFSNAYAEFLPKMLELWGVKSATGITEFKALFAPFAKAGRRISGATEKELQSAITILNALLEEAANPDGDGTSEKGAAQTIPDEPVFDHSQIEFAKSQLKECFN